MTKLVQHKRWKKIYCRYLCEFWKDLNIQQCQRMESIVVQDQDKLRNSGVTSNRKKNQSNDKAI